MAAIKDLMVSALFDEGKDEPVPRVLKYIKERQWNYAKFLTVLSDKEREVSE